MNKNLDEWEHIISAAAELQNLIPGCVLVGGTATAIHEKHRFNSERFVIDPRIEEYSAAS